MPGTASAPPDASRRRLDRLVATSVLAVVLTACATGDGEGSASLDLPRSVSPAPLVQSLVAGPGTADGAHRVPATGVLDGARVLDVPLTSPPRWIVGGGTEDASWWAVVDVEGGVRGVRVLDDRPDQHEEVPVQPSRLPPGAPPVLVTVAPMALEQPPSDAAPSAPPLPLLPEGTAAVLADGSVRLGDGTGAPVLEVDAPPDARMAVDPVTGALAIPAGAGRARRGESGGHSSVVIVDVEGVTDQVSLDRGETFGGLGPAWVDLERDGRPELATIVEHPDRRSAVTVLDLHAGRRQGPYVAPGEGLHLVGASGLGADRQVELVAARSSSGAGSLEWYRPEGDRLDIVAAAEGYWAPAPGSDQLDRALLTDGTGDRRADVVVPTADMTALAVLTRTDAGSGVLEVVRLELPGALRSNLAAVGRVERPLVLAAATDDVLRLWLAGPGERDRQR